MPRPAVCPHDPVIFPRRASRSRRSSRAIGSARRWSSPATTSRSGPRGSQLLQDGREPYLHEPYGEPVEEQWYGWRPMTYDSLPIIDRSPV